MLTKTTLSGLRAVTMLGLNADSQPLSPRSMAEALGESPSYLAKVLRHLVRAGILKAHRGPNGGVSLNRPPESVTLLAVVEACQGVVLGDFCEGNLDPRLTCAFHQAGVELHHAVVSVLSRWTLADLMRRPGPDPSVAGRSQCWLQPCPVLKGLITCEEEARPSTASALEP
ncbi:RrF2 family transcriptional regulator [Thermopirellula anaerolimosa]